MYQNSPPYVRNGKDLSRKRLIRIFLTNELHVTTKVKVTNGQSIFIGFRSFLGFTCTDRDHLMTIVLLPVAPRVDELRQQRLGLDGLGKKFEEAKRSTSPGKAARLK
ncbi:hypothetical protein EUGRSUZ_K03167 [Eucalyptus grandis]|uniref:Uncharacterized protein n=2 Tax=Eucalyptus grandis TaxID=71139 RepID=A0ACC3IYU0_EUCGR|nr:hypothetical protein EUGRSUZ_K03167 [Eucalyptus grandis]